MGLDHSQAFVEVRFDGLIGFCICKREDHRCEMGMVQVDDHVPLISILRIGPDGAEDWVVENRYLSRTDNVRIVADEPVSEGASIYKGAVFDPVSDRGDAEDFRWVIDLQGDRFHGPELKLIRDNEEMALRPRITIPHAIFYTKRKTSVGFRRFRRPNYKPKVPIGKVADVVGADILCNFKDEQKKVTVTIGHDAPDDLLFHIDEVMGYRYEIEITNLCRRTGPGPRCPDNQSDLPLYYNVSTDNDGITYDLDPLYPPGDPRGTNPIDDFNEKFCPELRGFHSNGPPEICSVAFFGEANSIP